MEFLFFLMEQINKFQIYSPKEKTFYWFWHLKTMLANKQNFSKSPAPPPPPKNSITASLGSLNWSSYV